MPARLLRSPWSAPSERAYWRQVAPWRQRPTGGAEPPAAPPLGGDAMGTVATLGSAATWSKDGAL